MIAEVNKIERRIESTTILKPPTDSANESDLIQVLQTPQVTVEAILTVIQTTPPTV